MIMFKIPIPPSVNAAYRVVNNRPILSKEAREYRKRIMDDYGTVNGFGKDKIAIVVYVTMPNQRRRDLDNLMKVSLDALCAAGWYTDDSQVDDLHIIRLKANKDDPHLLVSISEVDARDGDSSDTNSSSTQGTA
jgi:crossover junction endodeoxyribonuclease RusA